MEHVVRHYMTNSRFRDAVRNGKTYDLGSEYAEQIRKRYALMYLLHLPRIK
jgi:hypothetical protein